MTLLTNAMNSQTKSRFASTNLALNEDGNQQMRLLASLLLLASFSAVNFETALADDASKKPNIVFILSDDHRYDAIGLAGHPHLKTPNLDRIGKEGAWLRSTYGATPLCAPSRAAFLTGQYGHHSNFRTNQGPWPETLPPTFLSVAKNGGYKTAFIGKKHLYNTDEPIPGVDRWVSFLNQGRYVDPDVNIDGQRQKLKGFNGDLLTGFAVDFIKENRDKPFALVIAYKEAHSPQSPPPRFAKEFETTEIKLSESFNEDKSAKPTFFGSPATFPNTGWDDTKTAPGNADHLTREELAIKKIKNYYRCILALDDYVGTIRQSLEDAGVLDNTIFAFAGDNGYFLGEHGRFEKGTAHEESARLPFVIRYPKGIKAGTVSDALVLNLDLAPTIYDLAGLPAPPDLDGRSLKPIFEATGASPPPGWRTEIYTEWQGPQHAVVPGTEGYVSSPQSRPRANAGPNRGRQQQQRGGPPTWRSIRDGQYKYTVYFNDDLTELYDLKADPKESKNLVTDPAHHSKLLELHKRLIALAVATKDPLLKFIPVNPSTNKPSPDAAAVRGTGNES